MNDKETDRMPDLKAISTKNRTESPVDRIEAEQEPRPWLPYFVGLNTIFSLCIIAVMVVVVVQVYQWGVDARQQSTLVLDLKKEVEALRHTVTSETAEDIIYLKAMALRPDMDPSMARTIARSVRRHAKVFKRDPDFVLAMIDVESNFDPKAVSNMGAKGLLQVMPQWKEQLAISCDLVDPDCNIRYGLQIYAFYTQMYQDTEVALSAYNRGPGAVDWDLMRDMNPARNGYGRSVLEVYERLKAMSAAEGAVTKEE